jgi:chromosome segregation ATPase
MSDLSEVKKSMIEIIEELELSLDSDYPCPSDVDFKSLKKEIEDYDGQKEALSKVIQETEAAHKNYCIAFDDMESAKDEFQNTPDDSEEEEEADQRYSEASDELSNERGRLSEAIQDLRFALQDLDKAS